MRNLSRLFGGVLHFGALTSEDWRLHCDRRLTDRDVHLRAADWYERWIGRGFIGASARKAPAGLVQCPALRRIHSAQMPVFTIRSSAAVLLAWLAGCHSNPACDSDAEYQTAVNRPRLQLPGNLSASERMAPLVIPPLPADPQKLDPAPRCLDEPPQYFSRKGTVADPAEETVQAWAAAWNERKVPVVMQMYSPSFQAPGTSGSAEFLDHRREQIASGRTPSATLEDVQVTKQGADHRTVTFVQRFGDDRVRKELVLIREGGNWRIVSERSLEVL